MTTIAVMQPYLWPYAGYYRLLAASDVFVVYDCVQFVRRGRIHRNEFQADGRVAWFTLPLRKPAFTDRIAAVHLAADADSACAARLRPFRRLAAGLRLCSQAGAGERDLVPRSGMPLADFLVSHLALTARLLGLSCTIVRSSALGLADELRGERRILAVCEALRARQYVNVDGGRALYEAASFARRGVTLRFLTPYQGPFASVQERLGDDPHDPLRAARLIRAEIDSNVKYQ
ncbi:MAG: WbqC family protein [Burkholderiaceae bacterium]|nr:WbqC family protein [Burkholderiaceae bacterium]